VTREDETPARCSDGDTNRREYDKLVRDEIPRVIRENDEEPITHRVEGDAYEERLAAKLREETDEYLEDRDPEELADVLEVVETLVEVVGREEIERLRAEKAEERGGFREGIVLEAVEDR
jgi:predicted house-cleaning noncanonical NTP pyrophosphatase (MazG superfamily)